jgi:predicted RNA-binding protein with TRAM domain
MNDERLQRLSRFVSEARTEVEETRSRIADIEDALDGVEDVIEAEKSHSEAQSRDARDQLAAGDTREVVIENPPGQDGPDAVTRIDGIITFVAPQEKNLSTGDTVRVKLIDIGESHARAVATELVEG